MGSGIATALILSNYPVILKEVNEKFLEAGIGRVRGEALPYVILVLYCHISNFHLILRKTCFLDNIFFIHFLFHFQRICKAV